MRYAVCGMRYAVCGMRYAVCGMRYAVCGEHCALSRVASVRSSAQNWDASSNTYNFDLNSTGTNNRRPRSLGYALTQLGGDFRVCTKPGSAELHALAGDGLGLALMNLNMKGAFASD